FALGLAACASDNEAACRSRGNERAAGDGRAGKHDEGFNSLTQPALQRETPRRARSGLSSRIPDLLTTPSPETQAELFARARALAGMTLGAIAEDHGVVAPSELLRAKGWAGQLLERALGASAASRAEPDFQRLGIELKTLPIDARGRPRESTFVCTIALSEI